MQLWSELVGLTVWNFCLVFGREDLCIAFLIKYGLLPSRSFCDSYKCTSCGSKCYAESTDKNRLGWFIRCARGKCGKTGDRCPECVRGKTCSVACRKKVSPLDSTFFSGHRLGTVEIMQFIYSWVTGMNRDWMVRQIGVSAKTMTDFCGFMREVAYFANSKIRRKIGGSGFTIEIDECHLFTNKYNRGRPLASQIRQLWAVGGVVRETGECFVEVVRDRKKNTLREVIDRNVEKGGTIITDCYSGYRGIGEFMQARHLTINHSKYKNEGRGHFSEVRLVVSQGVSSTLIVTTNHVERMWLDLRKQMKCVRMYEKDGELVEFAPSYADQYVYNRNYFRDRSDQEKFQIALEHIREMYSGPVVVREQIEIPVDLEIIEAQVDEIDVGPSQVSEQMEVDEPSEIDRASRDLEEIDALVTRFSGSTDIQGADDLVDSDGDDDVFEESLEDRLRRECLERVCSVNVERYN